MRALKSTADRDSWSPGREGRLCSTRRETHPRPNAILGAAGQVAARALALARSTADGRELVDHIAKATNGNVYLFGGALRRAVLGLPFDGDLDMMMPNGDVRALAALNKSGVPVVLNRNRHHRYTWSTQQLDILQPQEFYSGFPGVAAALGFFDLRINALAVHVRTGRLVDPFHLLARPRLRDPGINWPRWKRMSPLNIAILLIRLNRILGDSPDLALRPQDCRLLLQEVVSYARLADWGSVKMRVADRSYSEFSEELTATIHRSRVEYFRHLHASGTVRSR